MYLSLKSELSSDEADKLIAETVENYKNYLNPAFLGLKKSASAKEVEWRGEGALMYDVHGNAFIDCLAGYGVFVLGHRPKPVLDAVIGVLNRMALPSQELLNPLQGELARKLAEIAPGKIQFTYFYLCGSEANEAGIKIARLFHRAVRGEERTLHVTFHNSFHGKTLGALSATNRSVIRDKFLPLVPGIGEDGPVARFDDLDDFERVMREFGERTASVIIEPVQGEGGIVVPADDFLPGVRKRCDEYGALLHVDEVQSGFCRSGKFFCLEHTGTAPDILTMAKAMSGGVFPMAAMSVTPEVIKAAEENPWYFSNTFGGSAPGCAASLAAIDMMLDLDIAGESARKGANLKAALVSLSREYPVLIKEVRGLGLWIGVEFVDAETAKSVAGGLFERDVLVAHTINNPSVMRLQPPAVILESELDAVIERFSDTLSSMSTAAANL